MRSLEARTSLSTAPSTELAGDQGTARGPGASRQLEDGPSGPVCPRGHRLHSEMWAAGHQGRFYPGLSNGGDSILPVEMLFL